LFLFFCLSFFCFSFQFVLEHTLLSKFLQLASVPCDDDDDNHGAGGGRLNDSSGSSSHGSKRSNSNSSSSSSSGGSGFCSAQLARAHVVVVPSLIYHCTPTADHGFMNKVGEERRKELMKTITPSPS
jgi:hypothetical protein